MSRCFPFPPPGYERKIRADDLDSLKKDKNRDKKQKKEKKEKEKEKKESKDRQEKERTDEKYRDKKDKKDKHRDKKKNKDKNRDKDKIKGKSLLDDEKRSAGPPLDFHLNKAPEKNKDRTNNRSAILPDRRVVDVAAYNNGESFSKGYVSPQTKGFNHVPESGRRSMDEERKISSQFFNKNAAAETRKDEGAVKSGWKGAALVGDGKEKAKEKSAFDGRMDLLRVNEDSRFGGNALGQYSVGVVKLPGKYAGPLVDGRERTNKPVLDGRMDEQAVGRDVRSSGSARPPNPVGIVQNRVGAMVRPMEKKFEQKVEGKEKIREKEGDERNGEKRKEKDAEKTIRKLKDREKEKKKVEEVSDQKRVQMATMRDGSDNIPTPTTKDDNNKDFSGPGNCGILNIPKTSNHFSGPQNSAILNIPKTSNQGGETLTASLGKRKDVGLNGVYDEHMSGPNKLARTTASTPPLVENGRSLEASQNSAVHAPGLLRPPMNIKVERTFAPDDTQRPPMNIKVDGQEHKINGITTRPSSEPSRATIKAERKPAPVKPPHPDVKHLDRIVSVPKMDEWPEYDDQDWLFGHNGSQARPEAESSSVEETPEVWAQAVWLPPVDMFALPYVIPR